MRTPQLSKWIDEDIGGNQEFPEEEKEAEDPKGKEGKKQEHPPPHECGLWGLIFKREMLSSLLVLVPACTVTSPGDMLKVLIPRPHPGDISLA